MQALKQSAPVGAKHVVTASIASALADTGLSREELTWRDVDLAAGQHLCAESQRQLTTRDISAVKRWIGFDDAAIRAGRQRPIAVDYVAIPSVNELADGATPPAARHTSLATIERAYLFADSAHVASYRDLINWHRAPFVVDVIALGRVTLHAGSVFELSGGPALIMIDELRFEGGQLRILCDSRIAVGSMSRSDEE